MGSIARDEFVSQVTEGSRDNWVVVLLFQERHAADFSCNLYMQDRPASSTIMAWCFSRESWGDQGQLCAPMQPSACMYHCIKGGNYDSRAKRHLCASLNHGGQHSHHAASLQPNCRLLGQHALH